MPRPETRGSLFGESGKVGNGMARTLYLGNKNYSSWSLRGWLALRLAGVPFTEEIIALDQSKSRDNLARVSPSGCVPVLHDEGVVIWESLAIAEYANELGQSIWPAAVPARAVARAVSADIAADGRFVNGHLGPLDTVSCRHQFIRIYINICIKQNIYSW